MNKNLRGSRIKIEGRVFKVTEHLETDGFETITLQGPIKEDKNQITKITREDLKILGFENFDQIFRTSFSENAFQKAYDTIFSNKSFSIPLYQVTNDEIIFKKYSIKGRELINKDNIILVDENNEEIVFDEEYLLQIFLIGEYLKDNMLQKNKNTIETAIPKRESKSEETFSKFDEVLERIRKSKGIEQPVTKAPKKEKNDIQRQKLEEAFGRDRDLVNKDLETIFSIFDEIFFGGPVNVKRRK